MTINEEITTLLKRIKEISYKMNLHLIDIVMNLSEEEIKKILNNEKEALKWFELALNKVTEEEKQVK